MNTSSAIADLQARWHTLQDLDRASALLPLLRAGISRRNLAWLWKKRPLPRCCHIGKARKVHMPDVKLDNAVLYRLLVDPAPLLPVGTAGQPAFPKSAGIKETRAVQHSQAVQPAA